MAEELLCKGQTEKRAAEFVAEPGLGRAPPLRARNGAGIAPLQAQGNDAVGALHFEAGLFTWRWLRIRSVIELHALWTFTTLQNHARLEE